MRGIVFAGAALLALGSARAERIRFYYDTVEGGRLVGGMLELDDDDLQVQAELGFLPPIGSRGSTWPVVTIRDNGPSSNRVDLVLVGDGYLTSEMSRFATHAAGIVVPFFSQEPFDAYAAYFNVHRVEVISAQSGVDELDNNIFRDTALDMAFGCFGVNRALCVNVNKALAAAASATDVDQVLAIANSSRYGGAGYPSFDLGTVSGNNQSSLEIALHEFGHSLADLADEYDYGREGAYQGEEFAAANVTIFPAATLAASNWKWFRWLDLPHVDTYEGGALYKLGVFRPTLDSKMRNLGRPFQEVNVEQLVMAIYEIVGPVDAATPPSASHLSACREFFVAPLQPADHALSVQWSLNGLPVAGAAGPTFRPSQRPLFAGTNAVSVRVVDDTPRIRDEGFRHTNMTFSRLWNIQSSGVAGECACAACGDLNADGVMNMRDAADFAVCFGGSAFARPGCTCADLNTDGTVDLADFVRLLAFLGAAQSPAFPLCGGG